MWSLGLGRVTSILIPKASNTAPAWNNDIVGIMVILLAVDSADGGASSPFNPRRLAVDMDLIGNIKPKQAQLVSGVNIKTINGQSLIGAGDVAVDSTGSSTVGDIKSSLVTSDHSGWVKMDGRLISSLTSSQQTAAGTLGFTSNIPDATNSVLMQNGNTLGQVNGSNAKTIAVENLPDISPTATVSGAVANSFTNDSMGETLQGQYGLLRRSAGGNNTVNLGDSTPGEPDVFSAPLNHTHNITISSINGGVTQQDLDITPKSLSVNMFIYLGL